MANVPTPPEPAWMRTFCPCFRFALSTSACQAVKPTRGMEAASSMVSALGLIATSSSLIALKFRECADSPVSQPCIDFVAGRESTHSRSDADNDPGDIMAQNERQGIPQNELEVAVSDFGIQKVDTSGVNLDQDVILPQLRVWHLASPHTVGASVTIEDECLHECCLSMTF